MNKKISSEYGITLLSLVVTVVVLILLTGVIININDTNEGVLDIANQKKEETEILLIKEEIKTFLAENQPDSYESLIETLKNYGTIQNESDPENATLITTVTSTSNNLDSKIEYKSYPYNKSIEYSTKWKINDDGFYERTITQYELNSFVNTLTIDEILGMTKDEIEKMFYILDIKTIQKKQLDKEDQIYKENLVIVNVYDTDTNHYRYRNETFEENAISTLMYLILSLLLGFSLKKVDKIIFKDYFIDRFNLSLINYKNIEKTEIDELRKIIKLKKENLLLLKEDNNDFISPSKILIKQRRHK